MIASKISNSLMGKKLSKEHCESIRHSHLGLPSNRKGKTHSEEAKKKNRLAHFKKELRLGNKVGWTK